MKNTNNRNYKPSGLGDTVENIFKSTGIDKLAKWVLGNDCSCSERKEKLNKLFPYRKPECLKESEYNYLNEFFLTKKSNISADVQKELVTIYNRVFKDKATTTSCPKCFLNGIMKKLEMVYKEYEK